MDTRFHLDRTRHQAAGFLGKLALLLAALAVAAVVIVLVTAVGPLMSGLKGGDGADGSGGGTSSGSLPATGGAASNPNTPNSGTYSASSDMRGYSDRLDVAALDAQLAAKGSALAGHAQEINDTAKAYNLDPVVYASMVMEESGWGTNRATAQYNNVTSVMTGPDASQFKHFDSIQDSLNYSANSLCNGSYYFTQDRTTLAQVGAVYAPVGASNDPNNTNGGWATDIASIANRMPTKGG